MIDAKRFQIAEEDRRMKYAVGQVGCSYVSSCGQQEKSTMHHHVGKTEVL
jgi:hypothetical protein